MKKSISILLIISILFSLFAPHAVTITTGRNYGTLPEQAGLTEVAPFEYSFMPASSNWLELIAYEEPATLYATYELADNVLALNENQNVASSIASAGQIMSGSAVQKLKPNKIVAEGGYVPAIILDAAAANVGAEIKNGTVVVDETTGTAFKVVSRTTYTGVYDADTSLQNTVKPFDGTYSITQPALSEVVKDFDLPYQPVSLTRGNIKDFAPNVEGSVVNPSDYMLLSTDKDFKNLSDNPLIALKFDNVSLDANLGDGIKIKVVVSGGIGIDSMDLIGRYSGFDGYEIAMTLDQECVLNVSLDIEIKQEIRIPLYGFDVSFGIGSISGGVFAILGMDGTLHLEIESDTFVSVTQGVRGGTFAYVPTSARPIFDQEISVDGDVALSGEIDGYIKFGPMVNLELFGIDLVGVGIFLGAGVHVGLTLKTLDIELYAIFNVYITIVGKTLNLANFKPTIFKRHQADTAGYRVKIMEAFVKPGRTGGTIETETDDDKYTDGYMPAENIPYRILVVPNGVSFDPNDPNSVNNTAIRKYPASGYAATNVEGEFIQKDDAMLFNGDSAYLEFQANGSTYFSDPVVATLPFENITITFADYFNDYVTGQVQPVRLINWEAGPLEEQHEWVYYDTALAYVQPKLWNANIGWSYDGMATCWTDKYGNFDTRLVFNGNGVAILNEIDVRPSDWPNLIHEEFDVTIDANNANLTRNISNFNPAMTLTCNRTVNEVKGSYKRTEQNGQIIDQVMYDEYIWIINPSGTRTVTQDEFNYSIWGFSVEDSIYRADDTAISNAIAALSGNNKWSTSPIFYPEAGTSTLIPLLDEDGMETGTALFSQRVTAQWVWQAHPDPVKITSADKIEVTTGGSVFQVTATGYAPFTYTLIGAPSGVTIGKSTGLITIPAGLAENTYSFTIRAAEDRLTSNIFHIIGTPDPYDGNDPSPPDEQVFTLTVKGGVISQDPVRTAPAIDAASHDYELTMTAGSENLSVAVTATGSTPITWSLLQNGARSIPEEIAINPNTGELRVSKNIPQGTYVFLIKAENDIGFDTQECRLDVTAPRTAPVLAVETHNYNFTKLKDTNNMTVPIYATGSTPITWSLEQTLVDYPIPAEVTIHPQTGVLTVAKAIATGTYYFTVRAVNDVGSDTQDCTLKVTTVGRALSPPFTTNLSSRSTFLTELSSKNIHALSVLTLAAVSSGSILPNLSQSKPVVPPLITPPNSITLRCDHALDVYTNDRFTINGVPYVHWDSIIDITVEGKVFNNQMMDTSPVCDNYHYVEPLIIPDSVLEQIINSFKERLTLYQHSDILQDGELSIENLLGEIGNFTENSFQNGVTYLEYGSLLDNMKAQKGGIFDVGLGKDTGTMVTGKYFMGLKDNKSAQLTFVQDGMKVTFEGKDVTITENTGYELYNFAYKAGAPHETAMLSAAGAETDSFTFGFAYHGQLPGTAQFTVTTDIAAGTKVNVYRYDALTQGFTMIAKGKTVGAGGVVTYINDTMSEYLITAHTITGAEVSAMAGRQGFAGGNVWWYVSIGLAAILAAAIVLLVIGKRIRKRRSHT